MANNVKIGPNSVVAKAAITFAAAGLLAENCAIVYLIDDPIQNWVPGRSINPIDSFVVDKGYYIVMKTAFDLTASVVPPVGGAVVPAGPWFLDNFTGAAGAYDNHTPDSGAHYVYSDPNTALNGAGQVVLAPGAPRAISPIAAGTAIPANIEVTVIVNAITDGGNVLISLFNGNGAASVALFKGGTFNIEADGGSQSTVQLGALVFPLTLVGRRVGQVITATVNGANPITWTTAATEPIVNVVASDGATFDQVKVVGI